jgi:hypothetical protein
MATPPLTPLLSAPEGQMDYSRIMGGSALQTDLLAFNHHAASNPNMHHLHGRMQTAEELDGSVNILNMKTQWIKNQLKSREKEFVERKNMTYVVMMKATILSQPQSLNHISTAQRSDRFVGGY